MGKTGGLLPNVVQLKIHSLQKKLGPVEVG